MTAFNYASAAATASRLTAKFGAPGAIRRLTTGAGPSYDPGEPTTQDYPANIVLTEYTNREIDGERILATDRKALVDPAVEIEPNTTDLLVTADGATLTIVNVSILRPAATTVLYELQVRR